MPSSAIRCRARRSLLFHIGLSSAWDCGWRQQVQLPTVRSAKAFSGGERSRRTRPKSHARATDLHHYQHHQHCSPTSRTTPATIKSMQKKQFPNQADSSFCGAGAIGRPPAALALPPILQLTGYIYRSLLVFFFCRLACELAPGQIRQLLLLVVANLQMACGVDVYRPESVCVGYD